jgi:hypothetical protein
MRTCVRIAVVSFSHDVEKNLFSGATYLTKKTNHFINLLSQTPFNDLKMKAPDSNIKIQHPVIMH